MTDEEKQQRIVDAVLSLVAKHGVQGTTTARIAATVGVSEPTIYRTFRNRREMLLAAADKVWQQRRGRTGVLRGLGCHGLSEEDM